MITPRLSDEELLHDIQDAARTNDPSQLNLWWLGQSGFLVQWNGRHWLLDPYLSDSLTKKYASSDKPHERMTRCPIDPDRLDFVSVVTSSHAHTDHLDPETLQPLVRANPQMLLVAPAAHEAVALERSGIPAARFRGLDAGQSWEHEGVRIHAIPAAHETIERDAQGRCLFLGYVLQFGEWTIYHSGDTVRDEEILSHLGRWRIDVAILPINGRAPERRVAGNLTGTEAAQLAHAIGARIAIPCHYEMFRFNTASPDDFVDEALRLAQPFWLLPCGDRWSSRCLTRGNHVG